MNEDITDRFIAEYSGDDTRIKFAWNGKHEDDFEDANEQFRNDVVERVLSQTSSVKLALIVDLYRALAAWSSEAWCIDSRVEDLARLMIELGGQDVARDFIVGAMASFDAQYATLFSGARKEIIDRCLEHSQAKLDAADSEDERAIWLFALEHFGKLRKAAS